MVLVSEDHRARCPQNNVSMRERFHEFYTVTEKKKSDISSSEAETALLWPQLSVTGDLTGGARGLFVHLSSGHRRSGTEESTKWLLKGLMMSHDNVALNLQHPSLSTSLMC